jgi:hypothetical protein
MVSIFYFLSYPESRRAGAAVSGDGLKIKRGIKQSTLIFSFSYFSFLPVSNGGRAA